MAMIVSCPASLAGLMGRFPRSTGTVVEVSGGPDCAVPNLTSGVRKPVTPCFFVAVVVVGARVVPDLLAELAGDPHAVAANAKMAERVPMAQRTRPTRHPDATLRRMKNGDEAEVLRMASESSWHGSRYGFSRKQTTRQ